MKFILAYKEPLARLQNSRGFTLVELMIGIAVSGIVIASAMGVYFFYGRSASDQRDIATMMENQRGAFSFLELNVRMTGFDIKESGKFGFQQISGGGLTITSDSNSNGSVDTAASPDLSEQLTFSLYDDGADGIMDLGVTGAPGGPTLLVAEGIQAIDFAFAYDNDGDGRVDTDGAGNIIWAVDTNSDDVLDANLDSDGDGDIDENDAANTGVALTSTANPDTIRMVRIWILAQTLEPTKVCVCLNPPETYVVGRFHITDPCDCFRRRVAVQTYECKNMGL